MRKWFTADTQTSRIFFGCSGSNGQTVKSPKYSVSKLVDGLASKIQPQPLEPAKGF
jgi:hypothetical protein